MARVKVSKKAGTTSKGRLKKGHVYGKGGTVYKVTKKKATKKKAKRRAKR